LFDPRAQQAQPWEQLRERLRARLGDEAVKGLSAAADHRPEHAWQAGEQGAQGNMPVAPGSRPGWLLSAPVALDETGYRVQGHAERIESGWWDGGDVRRDYFIETRDGLRGWAYRDLGKAGPLWLQGWFA
jgi:protein ImuB